MAKDSAQRLRDKCRERGIVSSKELYQKMLESGIKATLGGVQGVYYGKSAPNIATALPICAFLNWSLDEWFLGRSRQKLTKDDLLAVIGSMIEDAGASLPDDDPDIVEAAKLLMKLKDSEQKKAVIRLLKTMVGDTA